MGNIIGQAPATPIEITGANGASPYRSDLTQWEGSWQAPQALYDRGIYQDNPDKWYQEDDNEGSTWYEGNGGYGILVIDLKQVRTLNRFRVFQMMSSDGKVTDIEIFKNTFYTGSTAPLHSDNGWVSVTNGKETVSDGNLQNSTTPEYVDSPTDISTSDFSTRYLKLHVYNDGSYGNTSYIEIKGIKGYYHDGSYSINYLRGEREIPTVTTDNVDGITKTASTVHGSITKTGTSSITDHGICWNKQGSPTLSNASKSEGSASSTGSFTSSISGLTRNTTYYVRAYAQNNSGIDYGNERKFTTDGPIPAIPIEIKGANGASPYNSDLTQWEGSWQAPQALYDRGTYQDDPDKWYQESDNEGSTWSEGNGGYGILVIDLKQMRTLNRFQVFQMMNSDGKVTDIEIFKNTSYTGSTEPSYSDNGWVSVTSSKETIDDGNLQDGNTPEYVYNPTDISTSVFSTRYLMLYAYNDDSHGHGSYIELKGIKGYYYGNDFSINYLRGGVETINKSAPSGSGTSSDPYKISSMANFSWLVQNSSEWDKYYEQTADIDASQTQYWDDNDDNSDGDLYNDADDITNTGNNDGFLPIGDQNTEFTGTYDGKDHTIVRLTINRSVDYIGLFGYSIGTIKNLGVTNVDVKSDNSNYQTGGLIGQNDGTIDNCYSTGLVDGGLRTGGLAGRNESAIKNSYSNAEVIGFDSKTGGLVGWNNGSISKCYATGIVSGTSQVGGLVGSNENSVSESYSAGAVEGTLPDAWGVGGLVGLNKYKISNCYTKSDVARLSGSNSNIGGFCGYNDDGTIEYSYSTGDVIYDGSTNPVNKGFVGGEDNSPTYTNNFWDCNTSNQNSGIAIGATAKTTYEMKSKTTFTGWDFTNTWAIDDGSKSKALINDGYPYLLDDSGYPLPVNLLSFTGKRKAESSVELNWSTASEQNNDRFEIRRSNNGEDFTSIGKRKGAGNSNEMVKYQYTDNNAPEGTVYYRLKQVDYNGAYEYSEIVVIREKDKQQEGSLSVYPNPVPGKFNLQLPEYEGTMQVEVYNMTGQQVYKKEIKERQSLIIQSSAWPEGVYMTICRTPYNVLEKRIIKQ
ncbi:MAG: T9SS type A sorting domain-containing protein [Bacteroidales bacterium]|nr:T9SS type A sorting domain-containing protein [Bacteroidales bacterium]MCF8327952.1 T9SS type A sorting domain-containing protein [Bacteroidales bacterium]